MQFLLEVYIQLYLNNAGNGSNGNINFSNGGVGGNGGDGVSLTINNLNNVTETLLIINSTNCQNGENFISCRRGGEGSNCLNSITNIWGISIGGNGIDIILGKNEGDIGLITYNSILPNGENRENCGFGGFNKYGIQLGWGGGG